MGTGGCLPNAQQSLRFEIAAVRITAISSSMDFRAKFSRTHPSHDVIYFGPRVSGKMPEIITSNDVLEALKQALVASRDVIIASQVCGSKLQRVFHIR